MEADSRGKAAWRVEKGTSLLPHKIKTFPFLKGFDSMATATTATTATKSKRGRRARKSYLDHLTEQGGGDEVKKMGSAPSVPDEFDPAVFSPLKEAEFEDVLHYHEWSEAYHTYFAEKSRARKEELSQMDPAIRNTFAAAAKSADTIISELRQLVAANHDVSGLLAKISTEVTSV